MDDLASGDQTGSKGKDKSIHDRRNAILSLLAEKNFVKTVELGAEFGVSEVSIRKDLDYLESRGIIKRIHGGASLSKNAPAILFLSERYVENRRAKEAIAQEAARLLSGPNLRIYLDTGTTVLQLARCIPDESSILIYTNSLTTISALEGKSNVQVISLGGRINYRLKSMDGPIMDAQIDRLRFDICFLGAESRDRRLLRLLGHGNRPLPQAGDEQVRCRLRIGRQLQGRQAQLHRLRQSERGRHFRHRPQDTRGDSRGPRLGWDEGHLHPGSGLIEGVGSRPGGIGVDAIAGRREGGGGPS